MLSWGVGLSAPHRTRVNCEYNKGNGSQSQSDVHVQLEGTKAWRACQMGKHDKLT
jgi:hypothetical protein